MTAAESIPGPAYRILTERLVIRCLEPKDAAMVITAITESRKHLLPWAPWAKEEPKSFQAEVDFLREWRGNFDLGNNFGYGIFNPGETNVLGGAGLHTRLGEGALEIGYWIHKDHINHGYATEVSAALAKVAFQVMHVRRVEIHCDPNNVRSAAVPRKLGFVHEATLHNRVENTEGNLRDAMIWSLFIQDYPSSLPAKACIEAYDVIGRQIL